MLPSSQIVQPRLRSSHVATIPFSATAIKMSFYVPQQQAQQVYLEQVPSTLYRVLNQTWIERPAISFARTDGQQGFPLSEAFARRFTFLRDPDDPVFHPPTGTKVTFHIQWGEYDFYAKAKNVMTHRRSRISSISREKTVYEVAKVVKNFIDQNSTRLVHDNRWRIGPGFIELEHIYILELRNVSVGSYQAVLAVIRQA